MATVASREQPDRRHDRVCGGCRALRVGILRFVFLTNRINRVAGLAGNDRERHREHEQAEQSGKKSCRIAHLDPESFNPEMERVLFL